MRIAVHAFTGITLFHLAAPLLVFGEVSRQIQDAGWSVHAWTSEDGPVTTCEGQSLGNLAGAEAADDADLLVFPSWPMAFPDPGDGLLEVITRAHRRGARIDPVRPEQTAQSAPARRRVPDARAGRPA